MSGAADSFRKSAALRERLYALQPEDVQVQRDLMMAYGHLGDIVGGPAVINMGDYGQAVVWFGKAAAIAERMMAADPSNALARRDAGTAIARIGASQTAAGEYRAALENFRRAEPLLRAVLAASPESVIVGQTLAFMYNSQGQAFHAVGDENASIDALRRSIDLCRRGLKKDPAGVSWNHVLWGAEIFTADALAAKGETDAALTGVKVLLDEVRREPVPHDPSGHAYLARAMSANGAVHSILARKSSGENRAAEWRTARDFFGDSLKEWQLEPNRAKEPLLRQMRIAEAGLAQSRRELQQVGREPANGLRDNLP
jgi:predicted Zn-dependent protease